MKLNVLSVVLPVVSVFVVSSINSVKSFWIALFRYTSHCPSSSSVPECVVCAVYVVGLLSVGVLLG